MTYQTVQVVISVKRECRTWKRVTYHIVKGVKSVKRECWAGERVMYDTVKGVKECKGGVLDLEESDVLHCNRS